MVRDGPGTDSLVSVMAPPPIGRFVVVLVSAVLAAVLSAAVLPVLLLDLQGLVYNHYLDWTTDYAQVWYARADWIAPMTASIWLGLPPWLFVMLAAGLFRLGDVVYAGLDPIPGLGPRLRVALRAFTFVPFLAAVIPLSLALSTQFALELNAWIEWYGHVDPLMEVSHDLGAKVLVPLLAAVGVVGGLWASAPRGSFWRRPLQVRRLSSLPGVGALLFLLLVAGGVATVTGVRASRAAGTADGRRVHTERCGSCHERALPLYFVKTPGEWATTVRTHQEIENLALSPGEVDALEDFLTGMRAYEDAWTFRTRCQNCHGSSWRRWEARPAEDWEAIVGRIARWSPYFYSGEVRAQVARYVTKSKGDESATLGLAQEDWDRYQAVGRECDDCHSVGYEASRYADGTREDARAMVSRMSQKMAVPYDEARIDEATDEWLELVRDRELFLRLFPHDHPDDTGGGL